VGDAATRLLLLLVLLMVIGNCGGGLPVGVCGDKGDIEDDVVAGDGQLLALVVMAAEELLLLTPLFVLELIVEATVAEDGGVAGDCWLEFTPAAAAATAARSRSRSRCGRKASRRASTRISLGPQRAYPALFCSHTTWVPCMHLISTSDLQRILNW